MNERKASSYVVIAIIDGNVRILEGGSEYPGHSILPGPRGNQTEWIAGLAKEHNIPSGTEIHLFVPSPYPESKYCSHLLFKVKNVVKVEKLATVPWPYI